MLLKAITKGILFLWKRNYSSSTIRQKGDSQNRYYKKINHVKFSEKRVFLTPWYAQVHVRIRGKKCSFFGKFGVLYFLVTPVLRFTLLPYYRRIILYFAGNSFINFSLYRNFQTYLKLWLVEISDIFFARISKIWQIITYHH